MVALEKLQVIPNPIAAQPGNSRLELRQGHLSPRLAARGPLQDGIIGVIQTIAAIEYGPRHALSHVFDRLGSNKITQRMPQPPLGNGGNLDQFRLPLRLPNRGKARCQFGPRPECEQP